MVLAVKAVSMKDLDSSFLKSRRLLGSKRFVLFERGGLLPGLV